jgi:hypothetical protein
VRQSLEPAGATAPAGAEPTDAAGAETGPTFFAIDAPLPWALSVFMVKKFSNVLYIVTYVVNKLGH